MSAVKKPELRVIAGGAPNTSKPINKLQANNFWNTCPRKLELMPTTPCHLGQCRKNQKGTILEEATCPWAIDSEKHNFCFWRYVQASSTADGKMEPLLQNEIAALFGCSSTKIHFILKESFKHLSKSEYLEVLRDFYGPGGDSPSGDSGIGSILDRTESGEE